VPGLSAEGSGVAEKAKGRVMPESWTQQRARLEYLSKRSFPVWTEVGKDDAAIRAALSRLDELERAGWSLMERCIKWGYEDVKHLEPWTPDSDAVLVKARAVLLAGTAPDVDSAAKESK